MTDYDPGLEYRRRSVWLPAALIVGALLLGCAAAAWAAVPQRDVVRDTCDLIEANFYYDDYGRLTFSQIIFYDWDDDLARFQVRAWRLCKSPSQLPQRDGAKGYVTTWQDGELMRVVRAPAVRETWTQYDPELAERDVLPKERRKELTTAGMRRPGGGK